MHRHSGRAAGALMPRLGPFSPQSPYKSELITEKGDDQMPKEVDRHDVRRLLGQGAQLVDVMGGKEFEGSHIVGAIHIPLRKLAGEALSRLDADRPVITYCYDSL